MYFLVACGFIGGGLASNGMIGLLPLGLGPCVALDRGGGASLGEWDACLTSVVPGFLAVAAAWLQGAASVSAGLDRGAMPWSASWAGAQVVTGT